MLIGVRMVQITPILSSTSDIRQYGPGIANQGVIFPSPAVPKHLPIPERVRA